MPSETSPSSLPENKAPGIVVDYNHETHRNEVNHAHQQVQEYVKPLTFLDGLSNKEQSTSTASYQVQPSSIKRRDSFNARQAYQQLMTPHAALDPTAASSQTLLMNDDISLQFIAPAYALYVVDATPRLVSLEKLETNINQLKIAERWAEGLISQPLLLPIKLSLGDADIDFIESNDDNFKRLGIIVHRLNNTSLQIREYPAMLRQQDVTQSFTLLLSFLREMKRQGPLTDVHWRNAFSQLLLSKVFNQEKLNALLAQSHSYYPNTLIDELALISTSVDLTSSIALLN